MQFLAKRRITKLKIIFILSLMVLAALFVMAVFKPFASGGSYTEVSRQSLLQNQEEWIFQFDILNHEGGDVRYSIQMEFSGKDYREDFVVRDGGKFTYIHHIKQNTFASGQVSYRIYKENAKEPFETGTYYLK
jgi:hypothetical protein